MLTNAESVYPFVVCFSACRLHPALLLPNLHASQFGDHSVSSPFLFDVTCSFEASILPFLPLSLLSACRFVYPAQVFRPQLVDLMPLLVSTSPTYSFPRLFFRIFYMAARTALRLGPKQNKNNPPLSCSFLRRYFLPCRRSLTPFSRMIRVVWFSVRWCCCQSAPFTSLPFPSIKVFLI